MKVGTVVLSLVWVAVLSVATVRAEGEAVTKKAPEGKKIDFFAALDTDGNGTLSPAEFQVMYDKKVAKMKADKPDAVIPTTEEAFAKLDTDKSGSLTKEEFMASHKRGTKHAEAPAVAPVVAPAVAPAAEKGNKLPTK